MVEVHTLSELRGRRGRGPGRGTARGAARGRGSVGAGAAPSARGRGSRGRGRGRGTNSGAPFNGAGNSLKVADSAQVLGCPAHPRSVTARTPMDTAVCRLCMPMHTGCTGPGFGRALALTPLALHLAHVLNGVPRRRCNGRQDEHDGDPEFDSSASTVVDAEGDQGQQDHEVSSGTGTMTLSNAELTAECPRASGSLIQGKEMLHHKQEGSSAMKPCRMATRWVAQHDLRAGGVFQRRGGAGGRAAFLQRMQEENDCLAAAAAADRLRLEKERAVRTSPHPESDPDPDPQAKPATLPWSNSAMVPGWSNLSDCHTVPIVDEPCQ